LVRVNEENVGAFIQGALDAPDALAMGDRLQLTLGVGSTGPERRVINALVALRLGVTPGTVARNLDWKDFEKFCALIFKSRGYAVMENLTLKKPRAQIDVVAVGSSYVICADCKRWRRDHSPAALRSIALAQKRRSELLRRSQKDQKPILSAVLSLSAPRGSFVEGVAVVPIGSLTGFLDSLESYLEYFETR
jgi:hypothetical protein